jgi:TetR/AcrR family transcriptional repressor of nem operon
MRRSKDDAAETRQQILRSASTEFRKHGFDRVSVNDVMAAAGLTHGGFYRHFESKEHLIAESCCAALDTQLYSTEKYLQKNSDQVKLKSLLERYLSPSHRDNPATGCALAALASEIARSNTQTRKGATNGFDRRDSAHIYQRQTEACAGHCYIHDRRTDSCSRR